MSTLRFSDTAQDSVLLREQRDAKKLELKKQRAEDRKDRVLNARWRTMGVCISRHRHTTIACVICYFAWMMMMIWMCSYVTETGRHRGAGSASSRT